MCDVIKFICDLKLLKAFNINYFDVPADGLITIPWSINYATSILPKLSKIYERPIYNKIRPYFVKILFKISMWFSKNV